MGCKMEKLLVINACVNREKSRTNRLTQELVKLLNKNGEYQTKEVILENENLMPLDSKRLKERDSFIAAKNFEDERFAYARDFKTADVIVLASPFWEMGFNSFLKIWLENTSTPGILYGYTERGPVGFCNAKKLYYVTTRGSIQGENDLGYQTIKNLAAMYGIKEIKCIYADALDIFPDKASAAMTAAIESLPSNLL